MLTSRTSQSAAKALIALAVAGIALHYIVRVLVAVAVGIHTLNASL